MGTPYTYPVHCACCGDTISVLEQEDGEAVETDDGTFCNRTCCQTYREETAQ